jgi:hypothetical protein
MIPWQLLVPHLYDVGERLDLEGAGLEGVHVAAQGLVQLLGLEPAVALEPQRVGVLLLLSLRLLALL